MKINTIGAYLLVYLLARGHWNLMVPVRADEESDGTTGSASADAGSATNGAPESTPLAAPAANGGSTEGTDAGLTSADGSANGAGADTDASAGSPSDGTSTGDASADPSLTVSTGADGSVASSENGSGTDADAGSSEGGEANAGQSTPAAKVELGSLYPDYFTSGFNVHYDSTGVELEAKKEQAKQVAEDARKTAQQLLEAAEKIKKEADELTKAAEDATKVDELVAKLEATSYKVGMERSQASEVAKPPDMMYYGGFPDGWHKRADFEVFENMYKERLMSDNMMYYSGFPNGWHRHDDGGLQDIRNFLIKQEAEKVRAIIDAKKDEIDRVKKQILDLTAVCNSLDNEVKKLEEEHNELVHKLLGLDATLIKLYKAGTDGNPVLMEENTDYEKKKAHGDIRFEFKSGAVCTLVKFGEHELWKRGDESVNEPKLVAFNASMGVIAVRDNDRAVLYKKDANSDEWKHHNTILRKTAASTGSRTSAHTASSAPAPGSLATGLSGSKMILDSSSTGTPETVTSLNEDDTASVASGGSETNEANESETSSALRGSASSAEGGSSSGEGSAGQGISSGEYSSVFMD